MTGIELSGIVLAAGRPPARYELTPDPFTVAAGQIRVIVVPPEAQRALADVLTGLATPVAGKILVSGTVVTDRPPADRGIALVPADGGLLPHLTVEQNTGYSLAGTGTREQRRAQVDRVLAELELVSLRRLRPHLLSAEQRLRVAVARARCLRGGTSAVVVEDAGTAASRAAVVTAAAGDDLAVIVITCDEGRAAELGALESGVRGPGARLLARCRPLPSPEERPGEPGKLGPAEKDGA